MKRLTRTANNIATEEEYKEYIKKWQSDAKDLNYGWDNLMDAVKGNLEYPNDELKRILNYLKNEGVTDPLNRIVGDILK